MNQILFYTSAGLVLIAILIYMFSSFISFKYLIGIGNQKESLKIMFGLVAAGGVLMLIATIVIVKYNLLRTGNWWDTMMLVNFMDILLNLTVMHTIYRKWDGKISAYLNLATIILDANLRFIILYFF